MVSWAPCGSRHRKVKGIHQSDFGTQPLFAFHVELCLPWPKLILTGGERTKKGKLARSAAAFIGRIYICFRRWEIAAGSRRPQCQIVFILSRCWLHFILLMGICLPAEWSSRGLDNWSIAQWT